MTTPLNTNGNTNGRQQALVSAEGISKSYSQARALAPLSFDIQPGERVALAGPSGSGKTTLLYLLAGILQPDEGQLFIGNRSLALLQPGREMSQLVGIIHQQYDLVPQLPVIHNVLAGRLGQWSLWRSIISLFWPRDRLMAEFALDQLGIADKAQERTSHLSGGEQQRVAIARLMVQSPSLVLADEPVASLDPAQAEEMLRLLTNLTINNTSNAGKTLIVSLHSPYLIQKYCSRVIGLRKGRMVFDLPASEVSESVLDDLYSLNRDPQELVTETPPNISG
ncbi:MAG: ATP-binding cassette domain-containing protein [Chloroflexi bacterium]|nr:ATP-binding cassette domain-containing protein [Chloroflexota bacterium]